MKMKKTSFLINIIVLLLSFHAKAQYFSTGQDPASIKWRQINTAHFQIIYPEEYENKAQQLAFVFDKVYEHGAKTLKHKPGKISVVLHTHTVKSNGLVAWSPKRMELFTTPHQKTYAQDWLEQLAIHEFRHVVQMDKIQSDLPGILPALFGEQAAAAAVAAYLPFWFIEGDAVITETALTNSGRGRLSSFLMENKALAVEKGIFSYDKASMGSFKDHIPNRYRFGYWLAGAIREEYGPDIWSDVLTETGKKPFSVTPFNHVLKRKTGLNKNQLYGQLFQKYKQEWEQEIDSIQITKSTQISNTNRFFTNYIKPVILDKENIIALKESRDDIDRIVQIQNGQEETVFTPGNIFQESFSGRENMLIWSERRPDLRWSHADISVIVLYNLKTKLKKNFRVENKVFAPSISPDFRKFAAVEASKTNEYYLSVFDLGTGEKLQSYSTPDNQYFYTPCWDDKGEKIYFIALSDEGKYLASVSLDDGKTDQLTSPYFYDIRNPSYHSGKVYFTGSYTGVDNIYCYDISNGSVDQVSSVRFGADYPTTNGDKLIFSNYNSEGYHLASMDLNDGLWKKFDKTELNSFELADNLAGQEGSVLSFSGKEKARYPSKNYPKLGHLFNFHSWAPAYVNVNDYEVRPGISLFSQNKLGTAETELGYEYIPSEKSGKYKLGFKYSGFYPVFESDLSYGKRNSEYFEIRNTVDREGNVVRIDTTLQKFSWKEFDLDLSVNVPLVFSSGKYTQVLKPSIEYTFRNISHDETTPPAFIQGHYQTLSYQLYFQNLLKSSEFSIFPKLGQVAEVFYRSSPFGGFKIGKLKAAHSYLFFPGFANNHGIRLYNGYQKKETHTTVAFSDIIKYPRGTNRLQNKQMYSFAADYVLPIAYPDVSLGALAYIKRIRASLFYDYANLKGDTYNPDGMITGQYTRNLESVGLEIYGDGHFLRLVAPVSAGLRSIYRPVNKDFVFEFLLSVSFDDI